MGKTPTGGLSLARSGHPQGLAGEWVEEPDLEWRMMGTRDANGKNTHGRSCHWQDQGIRKALPESGLKSRTLNGG